MADSFTADQRSACMRAVGSKDTEPEMRVRRLVHSMGYRYALHVGRLPGKPDLVFASRRKVIFVHGCFWHQHPGCREGRIPTSRVDYWEPKLKRNQIRDTANQARLEEQRWKVLVIWECEVKNAVEVKRKVKH